MQRAALRYRLILYPTDRWIVWDELQGMPAEFCGDPLVGLNRIMASAAVSLLSNLNQVPQRKPDGETRRPAT